MGRKTRSDSKLAKLGAEDFATLRDGLLGAWNYEEALTWLEEECGVSSSAAALSGWYQKHCAPVMRDRRKLFALKATEFEKAEEEDGLDFTDSAFARLKQRYFEMVLDPLVSPKECEALGKLLINYQKVQIAERKVDQDSRRLKLLEEKAQRLEDAKKDLEERKSGGGISKETLEVIERTLGML